MLESMDEFSVITLMFLMFCFCGFACLFLCFRVVLVCFFLWFPFAWLLDAEASLLHIGSILLQCCVLLSLITRGVSARSYKRKFERYGMIFLSGSTWLNVFVIEWRTSWLLARMTSRPRRANPTVTHNR